MPAKTDFAELFLRSLEDALLRYVPFGLGYVDAFARVIERNVEAAAVSDGVDESARAPNGNGATRGGTGGEPDR